MGSGVRRVADLPPHSPCMPLPSGTHSSLTDTALDPHKLLHPLRPAWAPELDFSILHFLRMAAARAFTGAAILEHVVFDA